MKHLLTSSLQWWCHTDRCGSQYATKKS